MRYYEIVHEQNVQLAGVTKPKKTLTPAQTLKRTERQAKIQKDIRDAQAEAAKRISGLRSMACDV